MNGATAAPTAEPLSKIATAQPRWAFGNHSDTALVAPGQFPASPAPSRKRIRQKLRKPVAMEVSMAATEYHSTMIERPFFVPIRSKIRPFTV
jgi:hypothetical protein